MLDRLKPLRVQRAATRVAAPAACWTARLSSLTCIALVLVLLAVACGDGSAERLPAAVTVGVSASGIADLHLTADRVRQAEQQAGTVSAYQKNILKDNTVTFAEYQAAVFGAVACWQHEGFAVTGYGPVPGPVLNARGAYDYLQTAPVGMSSDQQTKLIAKCTDEYVSLLQPLWTDHVAPSQQDVQAARDALGDCLREKGYDLPAHPASQDFTALIFPDGLPASGTRVQFPPGFAECATKIDDQFAMPGFRG